jgi:leucine dehydrogenase
MARRYPGILNDDTIPQLKVKAICGSANNQLKDENKHSQMLEITPPLFTI